MGEVEKVPKIASAGERLADGAIVEPVQAEPGSERLRLLLWNGTKSEIGVEVKHGGRTYIPAAIDPTLLRAMMLPSQRSKPEEVRQLVTDISTVVSQYTNVGENFVAALSRFVLSTWVVQSLPVAPWFAVVGPESNASTQLRRLLRSLCRHALTLAGISVNGLCSLPSGWNFTLLISQAELRPNLARLLYAARNRDSNVLRRGRLHRLYAPVATFTRTCPDFHGSTVSLEIPTIPMGAPLSSLDDNSEKRIADEFQARLLGYLIDNTSKVETSKEKSAGLNYRIQELAQALAVTTPDDTDLQKEIVETLKAQDAAMRPVRLGGIEGVVIEAILFHCHEGQQDRIYISEIAETAQEILTRRGEDLVLTARRVGDKLRHLRFLTEPRDRRGFSLVLNQGNCSHAHELGRVFDVPTLQDGVDRCKHCGPGTNPKKSGSY
jgi:hypothetical protein